MADNENQRPRGRYRRFFSWLALLIAVALFAVHFFQFDRLAAITLIPPWFWLVPALIALAVTFRVMSRFVLTATIAVWILFAVCFVEEPRSLLRFQSQSITNKTNSGQTIRVTTLNCNMGSSKAALEPLQFSPDIVLFQESQGAVPLEETARKYFGDNASSLHGGDVSIVANGSIKPIHVDPGSHFVHAVVSLENGQSIDVVSLRLSAPVFRVDFLSAGFWNDHTKVRQHHRTQLAEIAKHLEQCAETKHIVFGGDFNLVGNDGALSSIEKFQDTYLEAGCGWGRTGTNDYPLFRRVDQIWTNETIFCQSTTAHSTQHSDHRMVIADLLLDK